MTDLAEGPRGLLAAGRDESCGDVPITGLWTSSDGERWSRVDVPSAFDNGHVLEISGGSAGYVATGADAGWSPALWLSADGRAWRQVALPEGKLIITGGVSFTDGFVLAGAALAPQNGDTCGGIPTQTPALWWTADGAGWSRAAIESPVNGTVMHVHRISDRALLAVADTRNDTSGTWLQAAWTSTDGRAWRPTTSSISLQGPVLTDGRRGIIVPDDAEIVAFDADLRPIVLAQSGELPSDVYRSAFGPAGLLFANRDGRRIWLGVPVSAATP